MRIGTFQRAYCSTAGGPPVSAGNLPAPGISKSSSVAAGVAVVVGVLNVPGAWTELIAATSGAGQFLMVQLNGTVATGASQPLLMDVATGAMGVEVAVCPSLGCGQISGAGETWLIPVSTANGARISVRCTSSLAAYANVQVVRCSVIAADAQSTLTTATSITALGANVAASTGTLINSNNTWIELIASTAVAYKGIFASATGNDATMSTSNEILALGIGGAGAEVMLSEVVIQTTTTESVSFQWLSRTVAAAIPAGTRVAAKVTTGATNILGAIAHGVPA